MHAIQYMHSLVTTTASCIQNSYRLASWACVINKVYRLAYWAQPQIVRVMVIVNDYK
jgi:hypothetical protein